MLKNLSFRVPAGRITGFLGINGAGKTTTMDIICGCLLQDSGRVVVNGRDTREDPLAVRRQIGYLPDVPPVHADMTVDAYLLYAGSLHGLRGKHLKDRRAAVLERTGLTEVRRRLTGHLSKGFRQRIGLAQALIHDPPVLVLDEPTEGLDPNQIARFRALLEDLKDHHTILLSSHILPEVESVCDEIVIIHEGRILPRPPRAGEENGWSLLVRQQPEQFCAALRQFPWIRRVASGQAANEILVCLDEDKRPDDLLRFALEGGYGVAGLTRQKQGLEETFRQITGEGEPS